MRLFRKGTSLKKFEAMLECPECSEIGDATVIASSKRSARELLNRHIDEQGPHQKGIAGRSTCTGRPEIYGLRETMTLGPLDQGQCSEGVISFAFNNP